MSVNPPQFQPSRPEAVPSTVVYQNPYQHQYGFYTAVLPALFQAASGIRDFFDNPQRDLIAAQASHTQEDQLQEALKYINEADNPQQRADRLQQMREAHKNNKQVMSALNTFDPSQMTNKQQMESESVNQYGKFKDASGRLQAGGAATPPAPGQSQAAPTQDQPLVVPPHSPNPGGPMPPLGMQVPPGGELSRAEQLKIQLAAGGGGPAGASAPEQPQQNSLEPSEWSVTQSFRYEEPLDAPAHKGPSQDEFTQPFAYTEPSMAGGAGPGGKADPAPAEQPAVHPVIDQVAKATGVDPKLVSLLPDGYPLIHPSVAAQRPDLPVQAFLQVPPAPGPVDAQIQQAIAPHLTDMQDALRALSLSRVSADLANGRTPDPESYLGAMVDASKAKMVFREMAAKGGVPGDFDIKTVAGLADFLKTKNYNQGTAAAVAAMNEMPASERAWYMNLAMAGNKTDIDWANVNNNSRALDIQQDQGQQRIDLEGRDLDLKARAQAYDERYKNTLLPAILQDYSSQASLRSSQAAHAGDSLAIANIQKGTAEKEMSLRQTLEQMQLDDNAKTRVVQATALIPDVLPQTKLNMEKLATVQEGIKANGTQIDALNNQKLQAITHLDQIKADIEKDTDPAAVQAGMTQQTQLQQQIKQIDGKIKDLTARNSDLTDLQNAYIQQMKDSPELKGQPAGSQRVDAAMKLLDPKSQFYVGPGGGKQVSGFDQAVQLVESAAKSAKGPLPTYNMDEFKQGMAAQGIDLSPADLAKAYGHYMQLVGKSHEAKK